MEPVIIGLSLAGYTSDWNRGDELMALIDDDKLKIKQIAGLCSHTYVYSHEQAARILGFLRSNAKMVSLTPSASQWFQRNKDYEIELCYQEHPNPDAITQITLHPETVQNLANYIQAWLEQPEETAAAGDAGGKFPDKEERHLFNLALDYAKKGAQAAYKQVHKFMTIKGVFCE